MFRSMLRVALIIAGLLVCWALVANAQPTNWTQYRSGGTTYYHGSDPRGGSWNGSSYDSGETTYSDMYGPDGEHQHCSSYTSGSTRYTNCN